jgi:hypothetical protein
MKELQREVPEFDEDVDRLMLKQNFSGGEYQRKYEYLL